MPHFLPHPAHHLQTPGAAHVQKLPCHLRSSVRRQNAPADKGDGSDGGLVPRCPYREITAAASSALGLGVATGNSGAAASVRAARSTAARRPRLHHSHTRPSIIPAANWRARDDHTEQRTTNINMRSESVVPGSLLTGTMNKAERTGVKGAPHQSTKALPPSKRRMATITTSSAISPSHQSIVSLPNSQPVRLPFCPSEVGRSSVPIRGLPACTPVPNEEFRVQGP